MKYLLVGMMALGACGRAKVTKPCPVRPAASVKAGLQGNVGVTTLPMNCLPPAGVITVILGENGGILATVVPQ